MRRRGFPVLGISFGAGLLLAACGGGSSASTPTGPSTQRSTETFNGTVAVQGCDSHNFNVNNSGEIDTTLASAGPPSNIVMQLGVGTPLGSPGPLGSTTCSIISSLNTAAGPSSTIAGSASPGAFCVSVCDAGNQTASVNYTVSVAHP